MYRKLRLSSDIVIRLLEKNGFQTQYQSEERGMITILAAKPELMKKESA
jgi:predicted RNA binding protein YcfA (HicA-like mRNA interferase family)